MAHAASQFAAQRRMGPANALLALGFVAAIATPGLMTLSGRSNADDVAFEFRRPAPAPTLTSDPATWSAFPKAFESFFGDRYGLRGDLLRLRARMHWFGLQSSPSTMVVRGEGDWIFLTASGALGNGSGDIPMTDGEIDSWLAFLERRRASLAERGIVYVFAFAPEKSSVYPEYLPWNHARQGVRRVDQLLAAARARGHDHVLDLTDALVREKGADTGDNFAYYPLGTHWSARGAVAGATAIVERLAELGSPARMPPRDRLVTRLEPSAPGDSLDTRLYLQGDLHQSAYEAFYGGDFDARAVDSDDSTRSTLWRRPGAPGGSLLVFHDSFGQGLAPLLATAFGKSVWEWRRFDPARVEELAPNAVVEVFVERVLVSALPDFDDPLDQTWLQAAFADVADADLVIEGDTWHRRLEPRKGALLVDDEEGQGEGVSATLVQEKRGSDAFLDLGGLAPGRAYVLRLECTAPSAGSLSIHAPYTTGPRAHSVDAFHLETYNLAKGAQVLYVHLPAQRTGDHVALTTNGTPRALRLGKLEARALPPR